MSAAVATEIDVRAKWPGIVLIGALTGLLSGLLGIGGAAILVPGMVDLLGMSQHRATGTSLFVIIPTAFVAAIVYAPGGQMDWSLAALFSVTAVLGATLGARATGRISAAEPAAPVRRLPALRRRAHADPGRRGRPRPPVRGRPADPEPGLDGRRGAARPGGRLPERPARDRRRAGAHAGHGLPLRLPAEAGPGHLDRLHRPDRDLGRLDALPARQRRARRSGCC